MVKLKFDLKIKFRAFGITFANVAQSGYTNLPEAVSYIAKVEHWEKVVYNDHGVSLTLSLE